MDILVNNAKEYLKSKKAELSNSLVNKIPIYLDTKYWITLKEQSLKTDISERQLFEFASFLLDSGKVFFPISEATFFEVLKHTDNHSLKQTIENIDRFSKGIALVSHREMIHQEFKYFLNSGINKEADKPKLVWTKLSFIAWPYFIEQHPGFKMGFDDSINGYVIDKFWNSSYIEIFEIISRSANYEPFVFKDNVNYFNTQKKKYENENKNFQEMFLSELGGILDLFDDIYSDVMIERYFEHTGKYPSTEELQKEDKSTFRNLIYHAFKQQKITDQLPGFKIGAGLYANSRWNKEQKHKENDTIDFLHASFALPYCDYFFTENSLAAAIKQKHTSYDKLYSCTVLSKENDVLKALKSI